MFQAKETVHVQVQRWLHTCGKLQVVQYSVEMVEMGRKRVEMKNQ